MIEQIPLGYGRKGMIDVVHLVQKYAKEEYAAFKKAIDPENILIYEIKRIALITYFAMPNETWAHREPGYHFLCDLCIIEPVHPDAL